MAKARNTRSGQKGKPVNLRAHRRRGPKEQVKDLILSADPLPSPVELHGRALEEWNRVIPLLVDACVVQASDYTACVSYCEAVGHLAKVVQEYRAMGEPTLQEYGQSTREHPMLGVIRRARVQVAQLGADLGLTPSSRGRMAVPLVEEKKSEFL